MSTHISSLATPVDVNESIIKSLGRGFYDQVLKGLFLEEMDLEVQVSTGNMEYVTNTEQLRNDNGEIIVHLLQIARFFVLNDLKFLARDWGQVANYGFLKWSQSLLRTNVWIKLENVKKGKLIEALHQGVFKFSKWNMDFIIA